MKKVLITGGVGFIGSVLVHELVEQNYDITVVDKGFYGFESLKKVENGIKLLKCGFENLTITDLENFDTVCHLAGFSNDPREGFSVVGNKKINTDYAIEFLKKCVEAKVKKFIFASSASVYGFDDKHGELTEEHEPNPRGYYSQSKFLAENGMWEFKDDIQLVILRQATVMGCSIRQRYDLVVNSFVKSAFDTGIVTVFGGGEIWRPLVNVIDISNTYKRIIELDSVESNIYNLVHKNYRVSELAHYVVHCIEITNSDFEDKIKIRFDYSMEKDYRSYMVSGEKIKKNLAIVPNIGVLETVQTFMRNFELGNDLDFNNPIYYNINWIKLGMRFTRMLEENPNVFSEFIEAES